MISLSKEYIQKLLKKRDPKSHKGDFGHALIVAGSEGKMGASVLASRACLRSGAGLLTVHVPLCAEEIMQTSIPEAMLSLDANFSHFTSVKSELLKYNVVAIGPGLGTHEETAKGINQLLAKCVKPMVVDADALNILSLNKSWLDLLPINSVLTPHPKEFERLVGSWFSEEECLQKQLDLAVKYKCVVVLKGAGTRIVDPEGNVFVNTTGNPGMAKGGSGDALTGMIAAFIAQEYTPLNSAILGVYLHGLAGDIAVTEGSEYSVLASDLIESIPKAYKTLL